MDGLTSDELFDLIANGAFSLGMKDDDGNRRGSLHSGHHVHQVVVRFAFDRPVESPDV